MGKRLWSAVLTGLILMLAGCGQQAQQPVKTAEPVEIQIAAAASLKDVLTELGNDYQKKASQVKLTYNFGASGTLQKQIEQGAPADIFISAATKPVDDLAAKNLVEAASRFNWVDNQLVLVVPADSKVAVNRYEDLKNPAVIKFSMGEPSVVPAGQYAKEVMEKLQIWNDVQEKAVLGKDVRSVLAYVETGNVEAGIVYKTDAAGNNKVKIVAVAPAGSHQPIVYPAVLVTGSKQPKAAEEFLQYLRSPESQKILEKYGFVLSKK